MDLNRRGFLGALPALVAGLAVATPVPDVPIGVSVEETAQRTQRRKYSVGLRYSIDYASFNRGFIWNAGV